MFDQATKPAVDEIEITVFGPGYGESIVAHLGNDRWIIVDSCLDEAKNPVAKTYLTAIGVPIESVKFIVASHWHDDHTKGISVLAEHYTDAKIGVSMVFNSQEAKEFAVAYSGETTALANGTKELYRIYRNYKNRIQFLSSKTMIFHDCSIMVQAVSPTNGCIMEGLAKISSLIPSVGKQNPIREVAPFSPNNESVVVHIDVNGIGILLGSDLETDRFGWSAVLDEAGDSLLASQFYKVAHHGSETAECAGIWSKLLVPGPISVLTPFHRGSVKLPKDSDKKRIGSMSNSVHISSKASTKSDLPPMVERRLMALGGKPLPLNTRLGGVRSRRKISNSAENADWNFAYFGAAGIHA